jgi:hypothetical protein
MIIWKPDTCECHIEEVYEGGQLVGGGQVLQKCAAHASVPDEELYATVLKENRAKNYAERALLGMDGVDFGFHDTVHAKGETTIAWKEGMEYKWNFEGEGKARVLKVDVLGADFDAAKKEQLATLAATKEVISEKLVLE